MNGRQPEGASPSSTARNLGTATRVTSKVAALRRALAAPIQQQMALLAKQGQRGKPESDRFLEKARAANPGATDDELTAFYNQKYGAAR